MAATGLLALLDDITALLDDVAAMSKVAATKTVGLAGDDLAVNAEGLVGLEPSRELPVVGRVALGSVANKFVLVPLALALPTSVITPVLMLGGGFLCYEGVHKVLHRKSADDDAHRERLVQAAKTSPEAVREVESTKIRQAMFTDVILSAEIVAVALGAVIDEPFAVRATTLAVVSLGMTLGIYGLVAAIVKIDDVGLHLQRTGGEGSARRKLGALLVDYTPLFMRVLSVVGTIAMFLVGGGIIVHGIPAIEHAVHDLLAPLEGVAVLQSGLTTAATLLIGVAVGLVVTAVVSGVKRALGKAPAH